MVDVAAMTANRYRGDYAKEYDTAREAQERWQVEDITVRDMLSTVKLGASILDIPCGTGRFLNFYRERGLHSINIDLNPDMLNEARKKDAEADLRVGEIQKIDLPNQSVDIAVCVRYLNLVPEREMMQAIRELQRVTKSLIIFTLRIGENIEMGQRHRRHTMETLRQAIMCGWQISETRLIHRNGWHMVKLCAG